MSTGKQPSNEMIKCIKKQMKMHFCVDSIKPIDLYDYIPIQQNFAQVGKKSKEL